ncbi:MAG: DUF6273 domain-containing protein [Clostridia bacterium]|nr:DUF6273 domain-containing protein [Clostridia bacterium]
MQKKSRPMIMAVVVLVALLWSLATGFAGKEDAFCTVGSTVFFGTYEQDNNQANGAEPIEWIVLDVQGDKSLLISKYGLDAKPYNEERTQVTWEGCTLRKWLNGKFLTEAFTGKEQSAVLVTEVDNERWQGYPGWDTDGGNDTRDKVFLLSVAEASKYFDVEYFKNSGANENVKARVQPTAYAMAQGTWTLTEYMTAEGAEAGWWWMRSPGGNPYSAASVRPDGSLDYYRVYIGSGCVRPALWIDNRMK